ncbi:PAS domain-containing sensor histidine kinase [Phaeobacter inhibens]|jgi:PAS domain S-box-containing protein|uniref:PAS domain-containing sensor histidine kinase n=1 Tax=Phaeobacter inhibens TaxID=221822 RepID=UPI000C9A5676|nr:PAS domain-containing sensor histidine kinase [Phaeobacter inhibens]AUQ64895.1 signal transduction histidine kinase [Phaeobacter inhibens]MEE4211906.1 PAS domain-containing sensor histidine kinase [Parvularcula sp.]
MTSVADTHSLTWQVSPDLLGIVNQSGVFVQTNPAWQAILGWSEAEIRSMVFTDFLHPDDLDRTLALFSTMKEGEPALHFENRYRCKDGGYRWLSWVAVPEGDIFVCSARDVTRDKANARALQSSEDEALLREQFIAILGHDLRNPLAAIGSAVRIASRQPHDEKIAAMFAAIDGSAERMAKLIDSIMDFARARLGGGLPVDLIRVENINEGFENVVDEIRLAHPDRLIQTSFAFDNALICDTTRLDQLLSNLVANAVTHGSRDKPITVATFEENSYFVMSVKNSGKTISKDILSNLFKPFERADESDSLQGLGLGLYIADQIAKAHSGKIAATSDETGTVFRLDIPLEQSS